MDRTVRPGMSCSKGGLPITYLWWLCDAILVRVERRTSDFGEAVFKLYIDAIRIIRLFAHCYVQAKPGDPKAFWSDWNLGRIVSMHFQICTQGSLLLEASRTHAHSLRTSAWWLWLSRRLYSVLLVERGVEVIVTILAMHRHLVGLPRLCVHALPPFEIALHLKTTILICRHQ